MSKIPDQAVVVRLGACRRDQYEHNVKLTSSELGFRAFSVLASVSRTAEDIAQSTTRKSTKYRVTSGRRLREAGFDSQKTFKNPLHYSVLVPDGITDEVWAKLEILFLDPLEAEDEDRTS